MREIKKPTIKEILDFDIIKYGDPRKTELLRTIFLIKKVLRLKPETTYYTIPEFKRGTYFEGANPERGIYLQESLNKLGFETIYFKENDSLKILWDK